MNTVLADPAEMIANGAPRVIHNDSELATYTEALFELTFLKRPTAAQREAIELLTLLVERYEEGRYAIPAAMCRRTRCGSNCVSRNIDLPAGASDRFS
jgi:HTH-type transcriptional regulator/antitoxin HigA